MVSISVTHLSGHCAQFYVPQTHGNMKSIFFKRSAYKKSTEELLLNRGNHQCR